MARYETTVILPRVEGVRLDTVGLIKVKTIMPLSANEVMAAIKRVCTRWVEETAEGRAAWELSSHDFNVGDLGLCVEEIPLALFQYESIDSISVEVVPGHECGWHFDSILATPNLPEMADEEMEEANV